MRSKTLLLVTSVVLLGFCGESFGLQVTNWTGSGGDDFWKTGANWSTGAVPTQFADVRIRDMLVTDPACLIDATHVGADAADPNFLRVGYGGTFGKLRMTGGVLAVGVSNVRIGNGANSTGEFYLEGGTASFVGDLYVANNATGPARGLIDISGGSLSVVKTTRIGYNGIGTLNISGGSMSVAAVTDVGRGGGVSEGTINMTGGELDISNNLMVGLSNSIGRVQLDDGTISAIKIEIGSGGGSFAEFYVDGGTVSTSNQIFVADNDAATGLLDMSDGSLNVTGAFRVGQKGDGTFNLSGGAVNLQSAMQIGRQSYKADNRSGEFNISGGTVSSNSNVIVGKVNNGITGVGTINMIGGEITTSGDLDVGSDGSTGDVNLDASTIRAANLVMSATGKITLDNGVLILNGDDTSTVQGYADNNWIVEKSTGLGRAVRVEYDAGTNKTTVSKDLTLLRFAYNESPADNVAVELDPTGPVTLSWSAGDYATDHDVYVGTSFADVNDATILTPVVYKIRQGVAVTTYDVSGLNFGETVYWRIDEVNSGAGIPPLTKGTVWSFSVLDTIIVENYDGYADTTALKAVWVENGAVIVLNDEFYGNSMGVRYNAASGSGDSEASLTFGAGQDWTTGGAVSLSLTFKGEPNNVAAGMYLTVEDGSAGSGTSAYAGDAGDLVQEDWEGWQTWDVDLAAFGVDLTDVTKLIIGVNSGSEATPSQDYGYVSFDDIILYPPRCKPEYVTTSFNYDCTTDEDDLEVINDAWLEREYNVAAVTPNSGGLQAHYLFDETTGTNAADDSGNSNDATVDAAGAGAWDAAGGRGGSGCLAFDGTFGVSIPSAVFTGISDAVSISVWVKDDAAVNPESVGRAEFGAGPRDPNEWWDRVTWIQDSPEDYVGQWNHYCFVKDVSTGFMWMYHNGVMVSRDKRAAQPIGVGGWGSSKIGASTDGDSGYYVGRMDDFQIYDYALSHAEVISLAGLSDVDQPLQPVLSPVDPVADGIINLFDIGRVAESWMLEELWP